MPDLPIVAVPRLAPAAPSPLASTGLTPVLMTNLLVDLLRGHFASGDNLINPLLRDLSWTPDAANPGKTAVDSALLIESAAGWDPALVGTRPALVVARGAWPFRRVGINNAAGLGRGVALFMQEASGSHKVTATGGTQGGDEADHLAWEAAIFLAAASSPVRERYAEHLKRLAVAGVGPAATTIGEDRSHPAVEIAIEYDVAIHWAVRSDDPPIGRVQVAITTTPT